MQDTASILSQAKQFALDTRLVKTCTCFNCCFSDWISSGIRGHHIWGYCWQIRVNESDEDRVHWVIVLISCEISDIISGDVVIDCDSQNQRDKTDLLRQKKSRFVTHDPFFRRPVSTDAWGVRCWSVDDLQPGQGTISAEQIDWAWLCTSTCRNFHSVYLFRFQWTLFDSVCLVPTRYPSFRQRGVLNSIVWRLSRHWIEFRRGHSFFA